MDSPRYTLNQTDWLRIGKNALIFLAPALLVFLIAIQGGKTPQEALVVLQLWGLNTLIDLTRKFIADNK